MFRFGDPGGRMYGNVGASYVNLLAHWTSEVENPNAGWVVQAGAGRSGGSSLRLAFTTPNSTAYINKTLDNQSTWGIAFAFRTTHLSTAGKVNSIVGFLDGGTIQCDLRLQPDGTLIVTQNGSLLGTTSVALSANTYYHIEFKVTVHNTAGAAQVWINGVSRLNLTGVNTRTSANNYANVVQLGQYLTLQSYTGNANIDHDDIIVYDAQATDLNGYPDITGPIGDCGLIWLRPGGVGSTTQLSPTGAATNWGAVSEATPDMDASYVAGGTAGLIDTYSLDDLGPTATTVKSLAVIHLARKDDVGGRGTKAVLRSAGANATHPTEFSLGTSYLYNWSAWGQNPNAGSPVAWTPAAVNALQAGQTVSS